MKFTSQVYANVSGSIGGITYGANKGGMYARARAAVSNRNTPQQQAIRTALGNLANRYNNTLTPAQRSGWDTYAKNVTVLDSLGKQIQIPNISQYIRSNVPRVQAGLSIVDDAPGVFNVGEFTAPVLSKVSTGLNVVFTAADAWATEVGSAMLIWLARAQNPSITFFKGPYRYVGDLAGAMTPPTSPHIFLTAVLPFGALVTGQQYFWRANVTRADGRLGQEVRGTFTA